MSTTTALTPEEVRALPAMVNSKTAFAAVAVGETLGYELINSGEFPVEAVKFGRTYRFRKADLLAFLGLTEAADAEAVPTPATAD
ncbi:helix-turn-helix domain-containing protein [Streptomyces sp. NPDC013172]|uniref:Helix-turn-helix domain-containing protein n=1 Tax=Streptomyces atriruber TaxID=545121 RepID=A0ABV3C134_9ACTN